MTTYRRRKASKTKIPNFLAQMEAIRRIGQQFRVVEEIIKRTLEPHILLIEKMELQRKYFEEINKKLMLSTIRSEIIRSPPVLRFIEEYRKSYEKLVELFMLLQETAPITWPKIETIRPQATSTTDKLLDCIDVLEGELAKEKEKNKKLLGMLERMKGKIEKERPSCIA